MRVIMINKFLYPKGGDAIYTLETGKLLSQKGHDVYYWGMYDPKNQAYPFSEYFVDKIDYDRPMSFKMKIETSLKILYSLESRKKIEKFINLIKPDLIHLNNFAHQISPSILPLIKKYRIPTVMTLHDYKLVCPSYLMILKGKPCEKCRGGKFYWCFLNRCTKSSYLKSLINTIEMYFHHKFWHVYNLIDIFIAPSLFLKNKLHEMGFKKKICYLPNFIDATKYMPEFEFKENSICYFGRLSEEKGLLTLIHALRGVNIKLKIIGDGPQKEILQETVSMLSQREVININFLGYKTGSELLDEIKKSMFVVLPSQWYENSPLSVLEAFSLGKPVIASRIGGLPELVIDDYTGLTFSPGIAEELREKIVNLINQPHKISKLGKNARNFVEQRFNPDQYYSRLIEIYSLARQNTSAKQPFAEIG